MPTTPSAFVWYDLMTTDPTAAKAFYTAVAGWGTEEWNTPDGKMPYIMWTTEGKAKGGIGEIKKEQNIPPHWVAHISSANVDNTVEQAKQLGGKVVHGPMDIPTVGRFAIMTDPQGAVFSVFTPKNTNDESANRSGKPLMSWHELHTTDYLKAFDFYSTLFGWQKTEAMDMGEMGGIYQMYGVGKESYGGMFNSSNANPPNWLFYITVDDADAAAKRVTQNGGKVLNGPMDVPGGGRIAQCMDPQGAAFAVHSHPGAK